MAITRDEAIAVITRLVESGILDDELVSDLESIRHCISCELNGYHVWGSDNDEDELYIMQRLDMTAEEFEIRCQELHEKYSFTPSPFELSRSKQHDS